MVTLTSSSSTPNTSFEFTRNNNYSNNLYGPFSSSSSSSFSYLSSKEDALTQKSLMSRMNTNINPEEHHDVLGISKKASEDLEISVFGAEKYFNGDMDLDSDNSPRLVSPLPNTEVPIERIFVGPKQSSKNSSETLSLRSESSWNSQSLLLQNKQEEKSKNKNKNNSNCNSYLQEEKNISSNHKVSNKKSFLSNLGCSCVCSNWNSVDVVDETRRSSGLKKIGTQMSFSANLSSDMKIYQHQQQQQAMLEQRKSLDIFGSEKRIIQKKLPWEYSSSSKTEEHEFTVKYEEEEDGSESDLSSDLFEIESLKGKAKQLLTRQVSSDPDSPNGYAPSEVSIEWSVVTASVADYSVMSECATSPVKNRSFQIPRIPIIAKSNRESAPQRRKSSSGGLLLGCKSHKSVRVSGDSYISMNKTPNYVPRFPVEANQTSIETRRKMSSSSVSHTQSPFLYIQ